MSETEWQSSGNQAESEGDLDPLAARLRELRDVAEREGRDDEADALTRALRAHRDAQREQAEVIDLQARRRKR